MLTKRKWKKLWAKIWKVVQREIPVLVTGAAMIAGAWAFYSSFSQPLNKLSIDWPHLVIFVPILRLPTAFRQFSKHSEEPWLIRVARAFKEGYLSVPAVAPDLLAKVKGLSVWEKIFKKK